MLLPSASRSSLLILREHKPTPGTCPGPEPNPTPPLGPSLPPPLHVILVHHSTSAPELLSRATTQINTAARKLKQCIKCIPKHFKVVCTFKPSTAVKHSIYELDTECCKNQECILNQFWICIKRIVEWKFCFLTSCCSRPTWLLRNNKRRYFEQLFLYIQWKLVGFEHFKLQNGHSEFDPYDLTGIFQPFWMLTAVCFLCVMNSLKCKPLKSNQIKTMINVIFNIVCVFMHWSMFLFNLRVNKYLN